MNKTIITGAVSTFAIVGAVVCVPIAAHAQSATAEQRNNGYGLHDGTGNGWQGSGQQSSLESRAKALNLTADQLREKLQTKTMLEIAKDQGLSAEQYQAKMREASAARWQARGLSDAEIKERTQAQVERQADCDGSGDHQGQGGFGRGARTE